MATVRQRAGGGAPGRAQRSGAPGRPGGVPRAARSASTGSLGIPAAWVVPAVAGSSPCRCQGADQRPWRVGLATRGGGDMLPEDRLACIAPTDGTSRQRGPCPSGRRPRRHARSTGRGQRRQQHPTFRHQPRAGQDRARRAVLAGQPGERLTSPSRVASTVGSALQRGEGSCCSRPGPAVAALGSLAGLAHAGRTKGTGRCRLHPRAGSAARSGAPVASPASPPPTGRCQLSAPTWCNGTGHRAGGRWPNSQPQRSRWARSHSATSFSA